MWGPEDIAELALQQLEMHEADSYRLAPWEGNLSDWRESASQAGDTDTVDAIDSVYRASEIYDEAARRLRIADFGNLKRQEILQRLVAAEWNWCPFCSRADGLHDGGYSCEDDS